MSVSDPVARPAADREGVAAARVGEVGGGEAVQRQRASSVTASEVLLKVTLDVMCRPGSPSRLSTFHPRPTADGEGIAAAAVVREVGGRDAVRQAERHAVGG